MTLFHSFKVTVVNSHIYGVLNYIVTGSGIHIPAHKEAVVTFPDGSQGWQDEKKNQTDCFIFIAFSVDLFIS